VYVQKVLLLYTYFVDTRHASYFLLTIHHICYSPYIIFVTHHTSYSLLTIHQTYYSPYIIFITHHTSYLLLTIHHICYSPYIIFVTHHTSYSLLSGSFVTLQELCKEVGNDAARFFYILRKSEQSMDFDLNLAKSKSNENPVFYV
jgi:hypothetical protein